MIKQFALTTQPTPVLSTPDFHICFGGEDGDSLPLDEKNLLRPVETVLLPKTRIELLEQVGTSPIWRIRTDAYPYPSPLFVDIRFLKLSTEEPPHRPLPSKQQILQTLEELVGCRYIWGGNWPQGINHLTRLYPPKGDLDPLHEDSWKLKGVDCSGMLYFATNGNTPRNTSSLMTFGKPAEGALQPLDLIVWPGHVLCVLDENRVIESRHPDGVVITPLKERLRQVPENAVVRRWYLLP
ncbi:MAG: peptidoglycan endopeptidase [Verrucomicrobia bacterium]|nr:peptidoglycan endopeptidase [Verrucomicrobiota bacterium]